MFELFNRMETVVDAGFHTSIEKTENQEKMADQNLRELKSDISRAGNARLKKEAEKMENILKEARSTSTDLRGNLTRMKSDYIDMEFKKARLHFQIRSALSHSGTNQMKATLNG